MNTIETKTLIQLIFDMRDDASIAQKIVNQLLLTQYNLILGAASELDLLATERMIEVPAYVTIRNVVSFPASLLKRIKYAGKDAADDGAARYAMIKESRKLFDLDLRDGISMVNWLIGSGLI